MGQVAGLGLQGIHQTPIHLAAGLFIFEVGDAGRDLDDLPDTDGGGRLERQPPLLRIQARHQVRQAGQLGEIVAAEAEDDPDAVPGRQVTEGPGERLARLPLVLRLDEEGVQGIDDQGELHPAPTPGGGPGELRAHLFEGRHHLIGGHPGFMGQEAGQPLPVQPEPLQDRSEEGRVGQGLGEAAKRVLLAQLDQAPPAEGDPRKEEGPGQAGQEAGPDQGRLADPAGPRQQEEALATVGQGLQAGDQLPGLGLPTGEDGVVGELEGSGGPEGAAKPVTQGRGQAPFGGDPPVEELAQLGLDQIPKGPIRAELAEGPPEAAVRIEKMGTEELFHALPVRQGLPGRLRIGDVHQAGGILAIHQNLRPARPRRGLHRLHEFPFGTRHPAIGVPRQRRTQAGPEHDQDDLALRGTDQASLEALGGGQCLLFPEDSLDLEIGQVLLPQGLDDVLDQGTLVLQVGGGRDEDADPWLSHAGLPGQWRRGSAAERDAGDL